MCELIPPHEVWRDFLYLVLNERQGLCARFLVFLKYTPDRARAEYGSGESTKEMVAIRNLNRPE